MSRNTRWIAGFNADGYSLIDGVKTSQNGFKRTGLFMSPHWLSLILEALTGFNADAYTL